MTPSILPVGTLTFVATADSLRAYSSLAEAHDAIDPSQATGIHTGEARLRDDATYLGPTVRTARYLARAANPGQTLATSAAIGNTPVIDLGVHRLADLGPPVRIF